MIEISGGGNLLKASNNKGLGHTKNFITRKFLALFCNQADLENNRKHSGFTLAEVLITLGIIGVVAAMTIPNLITAHQKRVTVTKLQKAISVINQAYKMAYDDVGEASPEEAKAMGAEEYFKKYWAPYIKVHTYCKNYKVCGYKSSSPFKMSNGVAHGMVLVAPSARATFYTPDGFLFIIYTACGKEDGTLGLMSNIFVDINGGKNPNQIGKDCFWLDRVVNGGGVQPRGYQLSNDAINENCSNVGGGEACAEKIKRAGWQIDKSYPWN